MSYCHLVEQRQAVCNSYRYLSFLVTDCKIVSSSQVDSSHTSAGYYSPVTLFPVHAHFSLPHTIKERIVSKINKVSNTCTLWRSCYCYLKEAWKFSSLNETALKSFAIFKWWREFYSKLLREVCPSSTFCRHIRKCLASLLYFLLHMKQECPHISVSNWNVFNFLFCFYFPGGHVEWSCTLCKYF